MHVNNKFNKGEKTMMKYFKCRKCGKVTRTTAHLTCTSCGEYKVNNMSSEECTQFFGYPLWEKMVATEMFEGITAEMKDGVVRWYDNDIASAYFKVMINEKKWVE
jgi:ribosomal protein L37E